MTAGAFSQLTERHIILESSQQVLELGLSLDIKLLSKPDV